jgi:hypothetical protein
MPGEDVSMNEKSESNKVGRIFWRKKEKKSIGDYEQGGGTAESHRETERSKLEPVSGSIPALMGKLKIQSQVIQMALVSEWKFQLQENPTPPASLKPSEGIWWDSNCSDVEG